MAVGQATELSYAVRPRVVLKHLGQLCLVVGVLTLVPLCVGILSVDLLLSFRCAIVVAGFVTAGAGLNRIDAGSRMQTNEALVIAGLVFLITPLAMAYPLMDSGAGYLDMVFEAVSALTTTGLSSVRHLERAPSAFLFLRTWIEWSGGLGFVVLSLALVMRPGIAAQQLAGRLPNEEDLVGSTKVHARSVFLVYCALTIIAVVLLMLTGIGLFAAVLYGLAAVSTGSFADRGGSLGALGGWEVPALIIVICTAGAQPLTLYRRSVRVGWREATADLQLRGFMAIGLLAMAALLLTIHYVDGMSWRDAASRGPLLALSAQTTAGFSCVDVRQLSAMAKVLLIMSMFVGGGLGSTTGGIKVLRLLISLRLMQGMVRRTLLPTHAVWQVRLGGDRLEEAEIQDALLVILLFFGVIALSWVPFLAYGYDPLNALFEVVSATSTTGLSTGVAQAGLAPLLKSVLCLDMLLGRLEVVALLVMVYPRTWLGKRSELR
jgi:trk/ktr system potassium uptake protein